MTERPLLLFPERTFVRPHSRRGRSGRFHLPHPHRQQERLEPAFAQLERIFVNKLAYLQDNPAGLLPEEVLVLETVGSVDDFYKSLKGLGLEWLGEYDVDDIEPDQDFFDLKHPDKRLEGRIYLVLHNQQGLQQLLSLWSAFRRDPEQAQFARNRAKFGHLFRQLRALRPWSHEDRLRETGLLEDWQERTSAGKELMRVELELWPRSQPSQRRKAERWIEELAKRAAGRIITSKDLAVEFAYHAVLLELPIEAVQHILENPAVDLARCEQIMLFRPNGQIAVPLPEVQASEPFSYQPEQAASRGEPVAALLDGLPLSRHRCLEGRLVLDDPETWEAEYPAADRCHGTAMASLILHGELDVPGQPLSRQLYVRPIMKPHTFFRRESIPEDCLAVDLIHRAVVRMLERDGNEPPAAPRVRIVNLSLGDPSRPFDRFPSPWARLLDFLAAQYNVLFVVSAGNHPDAIELEVPGQDARILFDDVKKLQGEALQAVLRDTRNRRLLSPAEAINVLTVGALNSDLSSGSLIGIDPLDDPGVPSLYSAHGPGFRRAIKPELLYPGGRLLFRQTPGESEKVVLEPINAARPPGHKVAAPGTKPGELSSAHYTRGTSNATALVTRVACQLHDMLLDLRTDSEEPDLPDSHLAILIRALLVHGASRGDSFGVLQDHLGGTRAQTRATRLVGYGSLQPERVLACTNQRVTLLGWGVIDADRAYSYRLPLPPSLNGVVEPRRLTTTLAWFSPINARHHKYRRAALWLDPYSEARQPRQPNEPEALLGLRRTETDHRQARRGTIQHEVWEGDQATSFSESSGLTLQVNCKGDAGDLHRPVPYGLVVTLEVAEAVELPIYDEVRARLALRPRIRPEIRL